jgi:geranylgeranyl diphosphate synthase, type II
MSYDEALVHRILDEARQCVMAELELVLERNRRTGFGALHDLIADYPFREGKGLRPAICLAACLAAGGRADQARLAASALELFHNAFLVHDDVEDGSEFRRGTVTMLRSHGVPIAVNVGDATNVLAMQLLLDNTATIGLRKALLVLREVERMARESVEGQAIELHWIANGSFQLDDADYLRMAYKKTCWYTVIAPLRIGVICGRPAGVRALLTEELVPLIELGYLAGVAFQICDDILNLEADEAVYGKEANGDLWEGKRTVMLLHFLRTTTSARRAQALRLLRTPRSSKRAEEISWLRRAIEETGSIAYGRGLATEFAARAAEADSHLSGLFEDNDERRFLSEMLNYVIERPK